MSKPRPKRNPVPTAQQKKEKRQVWVSCRATNGCEGKKAWVTIHQKNPGGGSTTRYKCCTCNRPFFIRV